MDGPLAPLQQAVCHLAAVPKLVEKFLFWSTLATLDIHPICAMDVEAIKFEWCCQVNMWLDRPAARQPNKKAQDAFRNLSWTLLSVKYGWDASPMLLLQNLSGSHGGVFV